VAGLERRLRNYIFRQASFSSFLLTKATKSTYFVLVFLAIPAIPAAGGMAAGGGEVLRYYGSLFFLKLTGHGGYLRSIRDESVEPLVACRVGERV
jgi:hypothetical protein